MPRALSDPEWSAFLNQVNVFGIGFPPWGGIVEWGGIEVLVFIGPERYIPEIDEWVREVGLTDVTDMSGEWKVEANRQYSDPEEVFWWSLPENLSNQIWTAAETVGAVTVATLNAAGQAIATSINFAPLILAVAAIALVMMYVPRPH